MKKTILCVLLALMMVITLLPTMTFAVNTVALPYSFDFETNPFENGWTTIDVDGDGQDWKTGTEKYWDNEYGYNGSKCALSQSYENYVGAYNADNWMLSPAFTVPASGAKVSWWAKAQDSDYPDYYEVYIGTGSPANATKETVAAFDALNKLYSEEGPGDWTLREVDIPADYVGQDVYIAFRHKDWDEFYIDIDNFAVEPYTVAVEAGENGTVETTDKCRFDPDVDKGITTSISGGVLSITYDGSTYTYTPKPDDGCLFSKWVYDLDGIESALSIGETVFAYGDISNGIVFTALFKESCLITFDADGGTVSTATAETVDGKLVSLPVPTRRDYIFEGWYLADGTPVTEDTVFEEDTTVYAKWSFAYIRPTQKAPHSIEAAHVENGTVTRSVTSAKLNAEVTFTVTPEPGFEVAKVYVTNRYSDKIPLKNLGNGEYSFKMPDVAVTIYTEFAAIAAEDEPIIDEPVIDEPTPAFDDINSDAYFAGAVDWAVENGITNGLSATAFGPDEACTRAQAVTFLWRLAGCPEVELNDKFTDVEKGSYYEMAVSWAIENGITLGTSETTFSPDMLCNRGHIVTFLYRYADGAVNSTNNPFTDVKVGEYYENPVLWAVENEITTGKTATAFAPADDCTRGQIVTFMWRLAK